MLALSSLHCLDFSEGQSTLHSEDQKKEVLEAVVPLLSNLRPASRLLRDASEQPSEPLWHGKRRETAVFWVRRWQFDLPQARRRAQLPPRCLSGPVDGRTACGGRGVWLEGQAPLSPRLGSLEEVLRREAWGDVVT